MQLKKSLFVLPLFAVLTWCSFAQGGYIDNGDGTITDTGTGLMWQQATASDNYTWEQALAYCENLDHAGYTDWRLPTVKELFSIVDTTRYTPAIDTTYFPDTEASEYWASTTFSESANYACSVTFDYGFEAVYKKTQNFYVRAVRLGQIGSFDNLTLWPVPDTGQTKCYDNTTEIVCPLAGQAFYGQDASYSINTPAYTKLSAGCTVLPDNATTWPMVGDEVTGLVWEEKHNLDNVTNYADPNDADNTYTWFDGSNGTPGDGTDTMDFIRDLNASSYGGFSDWRMPTVKELQSIVDYSCYNPSINIKYFPNTVANTKDWYLSSTIYTGKPDSAFIINFDYGDVGWGLMANGCVRAVRSKCIDNDGDGYGEYCTAGPDCNDNDSAIHATVTYYRDADGDGYGNTDNASEFCSLTPPEGYADNSSGFDVDDTDPFYTNFLPTCEVKIIPKALGWLIGNREKTRSLLVIGKGGTEFGENPVIKWEYDAIDVVSTHVFFKRFMFMRATFNGEPLDKQVYRVLVGSCEGSIKWAK